MLSHSQLKFLRSLQINKYRAKEKQFLVEGEKLVKECLLKSYGQNFELIEIFTLREWSDKNHRLIEKSGIQCTILPHKQLEQISLQKTPNQALGLMRFSTESRKTDFNSNDLFLVIDKVQDPGNIGTIFRLAEWFGIKQIILSSDSADPYNPKVVQSSMGSVFRVPFYRGNILSLFENLDSSIPIYGTILNGENIYKSKLSKGGIIVLGNESKGISKEISSYISKPLLIPRFGDSEKYPESLNVATAASIVLSEFRR